MILAETSTALSIWTTRRWLSFFQDLDCAVRFKLQHLICYVAKFGGMITVEFQQALTRIFISREPTRSRVVN